MDATGAGEDSGTTSDASADAGVLQYEASLIGAKPRPRVLFVSFEEDSLEVRQIRDLAGHVGVVPVINGFARQDEWDVVVTRELSKAFTKTPNHSRQLAPHLCVITFEELTFGSVGAVGGGVLGRSGTR